MEKITEICTCDDNVDSPCPRHKRENELQDKVVRTQTQLAEAVKLLIECKRFRPLGLNLERIFKEQKQ